MKRIDEKLGTSSTWSDVLASDPSDPTLEYPENRFDITEAQVRAFKRQQSGKEEDSEDEEEEESDSEEKKKTPTKASTPCSAFAARPACQKPVIASSVEPTTGARSGATERMVESVAFALSRLC